MYDTFGMGIRISSGFDWGYWGLIRDIFGHILYLQRFESLFWMALLDLNQTLLKLAKMLHGTAHLEERLVGYEIFGVFSYPKPI